MVLSRDLETILLGGKTEEALNPGCMLVRATDCRCMFAWLDVAAVIETAVILALIQELLVCGVKSTTKLTRILLLLSSAEELCKFCSGN